MKRYLAGILFACCLITSLSGGADSIFPFTFTENGFAIEGVDFGQVPQGSFHQRFIVITNISSQEVKDVAVKITGNYTASNCMSVFQSGSSCMVILNYKAPAYVSRDRKWLNIDFSILLDDGVRYADSQRLSVVGATLTDSSNDPA